MVQDALEHDGTTGFSHLEEGNSLFYPSINQSLAVNLSEAEG